MKGSNSDEWSKYLNDIKNAMLSERKEDRIPAIIHFNNIVLLRCISVNDIKNQIDIIVSQLIDLIVEPSSKIDHIVALDLICGISLCSLSDFQDCSITILNAIMPLLPSSDGWKSKRFFAAAFLASFSATSLRERALNFFLELIAHPKTTLIIEAVKEAINGAALLISTTDPETVVDILPLIEETLDNIFSSKKAPILVAGTELLKVVYESIKMSPLAKPDDLKKKYIPVLDGIEHNVTGKQQKKRTSSAASSVLGFLDGAAMSKDITVNHQFIRFRGPRQIAMLNAVEIVAGSHFLSHIAINRGLQERLGIAIAPKQEAISMRKERKEEIITMSAQTSKQRAKEKSRRRWEKEVRDDGFL